jgi:hypothetical protein
MPWLHPLNLLSTTERNSLYYLPVSLHYHDRYDGEHQNEDCSLHPDDAHVSDQTVFTFAHFGMVLSAAWGMQIESW